MYTFDSGTNGKTTYCSTLCRNIQAEFTDTLADLYCSFSCTVGYLSCRINSTANSSPPTR